MKAKNKFYMMRAILLLVALFNMLASDVHAKATAKKSRVRMKMYYYKEASGDRKIELALTSGSGRKMHGVSEVDVVLNAVVNDSTFALATLKTDTSGLISLYFDKDYVLPMDDEGKTILEAEYEGSDVYRSASNDLEIMDLNLEVKFEVEDSVKYLKVEATRPDVDGNMVPVEELDVIIGVQRLYSVLTIDDVETDEDGIGVLEFPNDIPGNADGNITVVAKVDESDDFGTVESVASQDWGVPVSYEVEPLPRQLFTDEAPLWMIASVFIILLGAWYHFFLSISKLIKLKKAADQD